MRGHQAVEGNRHAAVIVRAAIEHVAGRQVCNAHDRIVGSGLNIIAVRRSLRHSVEEVAGDGVRASRTDGGRGALNARRPRCIVASGGSEDLDIAREIGEEDLPGGQDQEVANE